MDLTRPEITNFIGKTYICKYRGDFMNTRDILRFTLFSFMALGLVFAAVTAITPSTALAAADEIFQDPPEPPVEPPVPTVIIPGTGQDDTAFWGNWLVWILIGAVVLALIVALIVRGGTTTHHHHE
jgi:hypothetical protein